jgi:hypothetical protein
MPRIVIKTQVDITNTGVRHPGQGTDVELNEFRNYTTLLQVLALRTNFEIVQEPKQIDGVWTFSIDVPDNGAYHDGKDPVGNLKNDLDQVPVITGLKENTPIKQKAFLTLNGHPNTSVAWVDK